MRERGKIRKFENVEGDLTKQFIPGNHKQNNISTGRKRKQEDRKERLPPSDRSIERESNNKSAGVLLIGFDPQSLLPEIDVIPDGDSPLMLDVGSRHRGKRGAGKPRSANPGCVGGGVVPVGPPAAAAVVVVEGGGKGDGHRRRRRGVVPVLVVLRRVGIWVLGRVRGRGSEHVAVRRDLRLLRRRWPERRWRRLLVVVVRIPPSAITTAASRAPNVAHSSP